MTKEEKRLIIKQILKVYKLPKTESLLDAAKTVKAPWGEHATRRYVQEYLGKKRYKILVSWKKSQRYRIQEAVYKTKLKCNYCNFIANTNYSGAMTKHLKAVHDIIVNYKTYKQHCIPVNDSKEILKEAVSKQIQCIICEQELVITEQTADKFLLHMKMYHDIDKAELYRNWPVYRSALEDWDT